jgi:hypothetical protein
MLFLPGSRWENRRLKEPLRRKIVSWNHTAIFSEMQGTTK